MCVCVCVCVCVHARLCTCVVCVGVYVFCREHRLSDSLREGTEEKTQKKIISFGRYISPHLRKELYLSLAVNFVNVIVCVTCNQVSILCLF